MAHRLFIHRLWNVSVKEIHCLAASTATSSYKNGIFCISASNSISRVSHRRSSFNVQDKDDFTERVINSKLPVLIDFHAQWVLQGGKASNRKRKYIKWAGCFLYFVRCTSMWEFYCDPFRHYRFYSAWYSTVIVVFITPWYLFDAPITTPLAMKHLW